MNRLYETLASYEEEKEKMEKVSRTTTHRSPTQTVQKIEVLEAQRATEVAGYFSTAFFLFSLRIVAQMAKVEALH